MTRPPSMPFPPLKSHPSHPPSHLQQPPLPPPPQQHLGLMVDQRRRSFDPSGQAPYRARLPMSGQPGAFLGHRGSFDSATQHGKPMMSQSFPRVDIATQSTRPHPHLPACTLYIDHVPPELPEKDIVQALQECLPFRITLAQSVPPQLRLKPDAYYDWMPRAGSVEFTQTHNAEKALAILHTHPLFATRGVTVSSYPVPQLVPLSESPARHLRPIHHVPSVHSNLQSSNTSALCPSPGEVFEALRPWGTMRSVQVWAEPYPDGVPALPSWGARVEFWFEEEARRFDLGFGESASLIKGWQIAITSEAPFGFPFPTSLNLPSAYSPSHVEPSPLPISEDMKHISAASFDNRSGNTLHSGIMQIPPVHNHPGLAHQVLFPHTPPQTSYTPPWSSHNPFTISQTDMPRPPEHVPFPKFNASPPALGSPNALPSIALPMTPGYSARKLSLARSSVSSFQSLSRPRKWSVTFDEAPEGGIRATGLVSDDGQYIAHGPGQHIRPAPMYGPGSTSASGLVDYSNVFVKNLDPDINSEFLGELFSNVGRIISARVMRDDSNRSRGYGFVSFFTPEEAMRAIEMMNGQSVGRQIIAVTLHEPRKLRPDKIAERIKREQPSAYGRPSASPRRPLVCLPENNFAHQKAQVESKTATGFTDDICSQSPTTRHKTLMKRVTPRVRTHIRERHLSDALIEPTVEALVSQDLRIVSILHNEDELNKVINEAVGHAHAIFSNVNGSQIAQEHGKKDQEANQPGRIVETNVDAKSPDSTLTEREKALIHEALRQFDDAEAGSIMPLLLSRLSPAEVRACIKNRQHLNLKANSIRRDMLKGRMKIDTAAVTPFIPSCPDLGPLSGLSQPSPVTTPPEPVPKPQMVVRQLTQISLDDLDLAKLASLPAVDIVAHLNGDGSQAIMDKLALSKPHPSEVTHMEDLIRRLRRKSLVEGRSEVVGLIARTLNHPALRKSQKAKLASDLVNAEDDDAAVCRMALYPPLLEAKIGQLFGAPLSRRVSAPPTA